MSYNNNCNKYMDKMTTEPCSICYQTIEENALETLSCGHKYHYECILETFKNNRMNNYKTRQCPYCRENVNHLPLKVGYLPIKHIHLEYNDIRKSKIKIEELDYYNIKTTPNKCAMFLKCGPNKGKQCSKNPSTNSQYCAVHKKSKSKYVYLS